MNVVVLGTGGWGTALALLLHRNAHTVTLWSHDPQKAHEMAQTRRNPLLSGVQIPPEITVTSSLEALSGADMAVFASPSFALRGVARQAAPCLKDGCLLVSATKGIERKSHFRMSQVLEQECGAGHEVVVLSGPSHAEEVALALPTGCVAAAVREESAQRVQDALMNPAFRVYTHDDMIGVELAGALKNVAALCCGISDGLNLGDNSKALLITRSLREISLLCEKMGGRKETLAGLAGIGDLIVTCTSVHSRNRRAGILIGQGCSAEEAIRKIGAVVEGYYASGCAEELAKEYQLEMPIFNGVYRILYENGTASDTAISLMLRQGKRESDSSWL